VWLGECWRRLRALLKRKQVDADLEEEMRLHVELRAQAQTQAGVALTKLAVRLSGGSGTLCC
jgi:hypothetical protein